MVLPRKGKESNVFDVEILRHPVESETKVVKSVLHSYVFACNKFQSSANSICIPYIDHRNCTLIANIHV